MQQIRMFISTTTFLFRISRQHFLFQAVPGFQSFFIRWKEFIILHLGIRYIGRAFPYGDNYIFHIFIAENRSDHGIAVKSVYRQSLRIRPYFFRYKYQILLPFFNYINKGTLQSRRLKLNNNSPLAGSQIYFIPLLQPIPGINLFYLYLKVVLIPRHQDGSLAKINLMKCSVYNSDQQFSFLPVHTVVYGLSSVLLRPDWEG